MDNEIKLDDIEEEVKISVASSAFKNNDIHCDSCGKLLGKAHLDIELPDTSLVVRLQVFRCDECETQYLNGCQANQLDRALALAKAITRKGIVYERSGNFDGSNVFVRFPAQLIKGSRTQAHIMPLSASEFLVSFERRGKNASDSHQ